MTKKTRQAIVLVGILIYFISIFLAPMLVILILSVVGGLALGEIIAKFIDRGVDNVD